MQILKYKRANKQLATSQLLGSLSIFKGPLLVIHLLKWMLPTFLQAPDFKGDVRRPSLLKNTGVLKL